MIRSSPHWLQLTSLWWLKGIFLFHHVLPWMKFFFSSMVKHDALLLDRCADQATPLGPGTVVVANLFVAEQIVQHEPGVAAALADAAVGDHVFVCCHALATVDSRQL